MTATPHFTTGHALTLGDKLRARGVGEATIRLNAPKVDAWLRPLADAPAPKRIRQSSKPLLNKLETEWLDYLQRQYPGTKIYEQAFRIRLANGLHYTPDLSLFVATQFMMWECKGPFAHRGGFENLKMAAATYPDIEFNLVWKANGEWETQKVLT